ncbi:MAG: cytochrome c oxidase subunit II [Bacteroidota bacterium]
MFTMVKRLCRFGSLFAFFLLLSACSNVAISPPLSPNTLDPHGPDAARIATLWWVMLAFGTVIFLVVTGLLLAALLRRKRATSDTAPEIDNLDEGSRWPILGGILLPLVVLTVVFGYSIFTLAAVENPFGKKDVQIEVVGRRWWWEVKYPDEGVVTANEIHIPVGKPVEITLQTADVIHSFWIPQLHGKMDLIPKRINKIVIQADQPGVYRGECAEFCGLQHAHMGFMVVAQSQADYDSWVQAQSQSAAEPADANTQKGQQVFMNAGCVFCHTVRGLDDKQIDRSGIDLGPDLTHLDSRLTIAGASLTKNRGNLAGWVIDPQHVKPGSLMPEMHMNSEDLQALLAYLESLH